MAAKICKLEEQFQKEKQKDGMSSCIFSGVAIYVNGYTGQTSPTCAVITNVKMKAIT